PPAASPVDRPGSGRPLRRTAAESGPGRFRRFQRMSMQVDIDMQLAVCSDGGSLRLKRRGISYEPAAQEKRQEADRNVDEEYPTPIVVVGDPAAEDRPDRRGCYDYDRVQSERRRTFGRRECVHQNRL